MGHYCIDCVAMQENHPPSANNSQSIQTRQLSRQRFLRQGEQICQVGPQGKCFDEKIWFCKITNNLRNYIF
jgi:hypothetical protein